MMRLHVFLAGLALLLLGVGSVAAYSYDRGYSYSDVTYVSGAYQPGFYVHSTSGYDGYARYSSNEYIADGWTIRNGYSTGRYGGRYGAPRTCAGNGCRYWNSYYHNGYSGSYYGGSVYPGGIGTPTYYNQHYNQIWGSPRYY